MSERPAILGSTPATERPAINGSMSQANIRADMLDAATLNVSMPALWERSYLCPCRDRSTRQPNQSCKICRGRGIGYLPPIRIDLMVQSQEKGLFNGDLGLMDSGTAIGTPQDRSLTISFRDRITLPHTSVSQSFIFDVSDRRIKNGFFMVYDVKEITLAMSINGELVEGQDYTVDFKSNLFFPNEKLKGKVISINIMTTLRYMVADLLKEHRYAPTQQVKAERMQQKLLLKREDIFIDKEAFELGASNEEVQEMIDPKRKPSTDGLNGFFRNGGNRLEES
ncbi:hypothetical protein Bp8pC_126 [Bacillus phage Bp8p-C]|uniref:Uncharacterized protein n=2 Tax=Agatevirus Bp8pC TaxID=1910937 RepID=A0A0A0PUS5_9CAUD|nr:virion structural protein [Bacillus phage Bp8p-C]YP_009784426.1 hypothetical protein QLX39_gp125 [Bacillus phage Bp8p-T]AHJ87556.1 hypothetical protein Bp8pC_126 [Bacillus phage Bp8p-C]AHJ87767.1 hypothetical protein Bp8pT_126 [Bacillus phage Bp8p-T]